MTKLQSEGKIVLAVASCGIAALLLQGGRTTHSRFRIPINITDESTCEINKPKNVQNQARNLSHITAQEDLSNSVG